MAKKKAPVYSGSSKDKAKALREAQRKADVRTRTVIISVVAVVVIAIIVAITLVVMSQDKKNSEETSSVSGSVAIPEAFAQGEPIIVSDLGVGTRNDELPDLEIYFSYTCHWCTYLETNVGEMLAADAEAGKYNLVLQPVASVDMSWRGPATNAALWVAAEDPDNFLKFHMALMTYFMDAYNDSNADVIQNSAASISTVAELAAANGVSEEVIAKFGGDATTYLDSATAAWESVEIEGRDSSSFGTPEIVYSGTMVNWGKGTPEEIYSQIISGMTELGYSAE